MTISPETTDISELQKIAHELRIDVLEMLTKAGSGHIGGAFGMADIFATLYFSFLSVFPEDPNSPDRDYCLLSNGHICPIWYATLARKGFFGMEELDSLRQINSLLQGHPHVSIPGVENSSGPLGHGLSQAVGVALALQLNKKHKAESLRQTPFKGLRTLQGLERQTVSLSNGTKQKEGYIIGETSGLPYSMKQKVVCCMSDGEHQEGQTWEAIMSAHKFQLGNLIAIVDYNGLQIEGTTDEVMPLGDLGQKYKDFGWDVREIDGHDFTQILEALQWADDCKKPAVILARTVLGKGVSFMENNWKYHDWAGNSDDAQKARTELST